MHGVVAILKSLHMTSAFKPGDEWSLKYDGFMSFRWSEKSMEYNVVVYSSGECTFVPRYVWKLPCRRSGSSAKCTIKLGSWTYDGTKVMWHLLLYFIYTAEWHCGTRDIPLPRSIDTMLKSWHPLGTVQPIIISECWRSPYIALTLTTFSNAKEWGFAA